MPRDEARNSPREALEMGRALVNELADILFDRQILVRLSRIEAKIDLLLRDTGIIIKGEKEMAGELQRLRDSVAAENTVIASAVTLLSQLGDLIRNNAGDPDALNALADDIDAQKSALAAAVEANTPMA